MTSPLKHPLPYPLSINVQGVCASPLDFIDIRRLAALSYRVSALEVIANATMREEVYAYARAISLIRIAAFMLSKNSDNQPVSTDTVLKRKKKSKQSALTNRELILEKVIPYTNNELRSIIQSTGALLPHHVIPAKREPALRIVAIALAPYIARQILRQQSVTQ